MSVRLSVTRRQYCVEATKRILKLFHRRVAITPFQFFHTKLYGTIPTEALRRRRMQAV